MKKKINMDSAYVSSSDIVSREIEGKIILIPLTSGIVSIENELMSFNKTGRSIWENINKGKTLNEIVKILSKKYDEQPDIIGKNVEGLALTLLEKGIIVESNEE